MTEDNTHSKGWSRRRVLGTAASGLALAAASSFPMPALAQSKKLTYWGGLIFSDEANKLLTDTINAWGAANGVATEVVMINQNEQVQKTSAAVSSNTMPDALDVGLGLATQLGRQGQFADIGELYAKIGAANGGWYEGTDKASDTTVDAGYRVGIPYGVSGNLLFRRKDLLEPAGFTEAPKTWEELVVQAAAITKAPVSGLGLALSNVGDANSIQTAVLQSYGGRVADDAGKKVTLDTPETRLWLTWLKDAWDKGLFAPGNTTWDGAGDNQSYLSGQSGFICNTGSVAIAARNDDPELFEASAFSPLPGGPKGIISPIDVQLRVINKNSPAQDEARALLEHLASPEFTNEYFKVAIYGPVLKAQDSLPAFDGSNPILIGLLGLAQNGTAPAAPDVYNAAWADFGANFIIPKIAQRVVVDGWDFDRAIAEGQAQGQAIYDKYA